MAMSHADVLVKSTIAGRCMFRYRIYTRSEHASTTYGIVLTHHGENEWIVSWIVSSINDEIDLPADFFCGSKTSGEEPSTIHGLSRIEQISKHERRGSEDLRP